MKPGLKKGLCCLLSVIVLLTTTACSGVTEQSTSTSSPSAQRISPSSLIPTTMDGNAGLPSGYLLEVQHTGERSGVIRLTDPRLDETEPLGVSDDADSVGDYLYCWEIGIGDTWLLERAFLIGAKDNPSEMGYPVEHVARLKYVENGQAKPVSEVTVLTGEKTITWDFSIPDGYDFSWDNISEYTVRIEHELDAISNLSATDAAANAVWVGEEAQRLPFVMAFQDQSVIFRMSKIEKDMEIRFGDFGLYTTTNEEIDYYLNTDSYEGIKLDLLYTYLNAYAEVDPVAGWESTWGEDCYFIKIDIPPNTTDELSDGTDEILIDWSRVENSHGISVAEKENGEVVEKSRTYFEYDDVVVDYAELETQFNYAWVENRLQPLENPMPQRGTIFDLPADFGYEIHATDESYFFCYTDDYTVLKGDLRTIFVDSKVVGKADMYVAYCFEPDGETSYFEAVKFVLDDHFQALQLVRDLAATTPAGRAGVLSEYIVIDNVVYPYHLGEPNTSLNSWKEIPTVIWGNFPYASSDDDKVWLYPYIEAWHLAAIHYRNRPGLGIVRFSKEKMFAQWEVIKDSGAWSFYASKPQ